MPSCLERGGKRKAWGTTRQSVSPICLARSWSLVSLQAMENRGDWWRLSQFQKWQILPDKFGDFLQWVYSTGVWGKQLMSSIWAYAKHFIQSCMTSLSKTEINGCDGWTVQWIRHCFYGCTGKAVISSSVSRWRLVTWCSSEVWIRTSIIEDLSAAWTVGLSVVSKFVDDDKLSGMADKLEWRDALEGESWQTWEVGFCKPHEVQQSQAQGLSSGLEQLPVSVGDDGWWCQAGWWMNWE